jgi:hypothetical protein
MNDTPELSTAPWTEDEVRNLEDWQSCPWVHAYTCGHCRDADPLCDDEHALVPTVYGWRCPTCDMRQNWCMALMVNGPPPLDPFEAKP